MDCPPPFFPEQSDADELNKRLVELGEKLKTDSNLSQLFLGAAILEQASDPIIGQTLDGTIVVWNRGAEQVFGYTTQEIVGQSINRLLPPGCEEEHTRLVERIQRGERVVSFETKRQCKDGRLLDIALTTSPIRDVDGHLLGISSIARDITPQKQALEDLRAISLFPAENPNPVVQFTGDGTVTYANAAAHPVLATIGCQVGEQPYVGWRDFVRHVLSSEKNYELDLDCAERIFHLLFVPVVKSGRVNVYGYDITERKLAAEAIRQSREDLNRAQAVAQTGSWRLDMQHNKLLWSAETYRIFGIPQGDSLTYEFFLEAVHPDDREAVDHAWQLAQSGAPYDIEHRIVIGEDVKWVRERAELEIDNDGNMRGGFGTVQDITERKLAQADTEHARRWLEQIAQTTPDIIFVLDIVNNRNVYANRSLLEILGYSPQELQAMPALMENVIDPQDLEEVLQFYRAMAEAKPSEVQILRHRTRHKDGRILWVENRVTPFAWDQAGQVTEVIGLARDITESKHMEEALRESEERFRTAVVSAPFPIIIHTEDGEVVTVNNAWVNLSGYRADELLTIEDWTNHAFGDQAEAARAAIQQLFKSEGASSQRERVICTASGELLTWVFSSSRLGRDAQGREQIITIALDITHRKQTEKALQQSEERFRQLADSMPQLVWTARADGTIDYYNQRYREFAGIQPVDDNWKWTPVLHPDDLQPTIEAWQHAVETGTPYQIEHRIYVADGSLRWFLSRGLPVRDAEGQIIRWYGTSTDMHERKLTEERTALLQELTADLSQAVTIGAVASVVVNKVLQAVGGDIGALALVTPDKSALTVTAVQGASEELRRQFQRTSLDLPIPLTDAVRRGEAIWIENQEDYITQYPATASFMMNISDSHATACLPLIADEQAIGVIGISFSHPVSFRQEDRDFLLSLAQQCAQAIERARLYDVVQQERDKLRALLDSMTEEVWFCEPSGQIQLVNSAAIQGLGFDQHQALPQSIDLLTQLDIRNADGSPRPIEESLLMQALRTGTTFKDVELIMHHIQTREPHYRQASAAPIRNQAGDIVGAVSVIRDVTDQKRAEQQSRDLMAERERIRVLTEFVHNISHDFKTPLSTIKTGLYLLTRVSEPEKQQHQIAKIEEQTQRLVDLLDGMLNMTRLERDAVLKLQSVDLNQLVSEIYNRKLAAIKNKELATQLILSNEWVEILADPALLEQAVVKIIDNAVRFTPIGGAVTLQIHRLQTMATIDIHDTGIGISKDDLIHIFERLYRADKARSTHSGGIGLGLSIAQKILHMHGGDIEVESVLGKGSTFRVLLPIAH